MAECIYDALPRLIIEYPKCGNCHEDVDIEDDLATCPRCLIQWDGVDEDARPEPDPNVEGVDVVCGVESTFHSVHTSIRNLPCSLPAAHTGDHHHPWTYTPEEHQEEK